MCSTHAFSSRTTCSASTGVSFRLHPEIFKHQFTSRRYLKTLSHQTCGAAAKKKCTWHHWCWLGTHHETEIIYPEINYSFCWMQSWRHNTIDDSITWMPLLLTLAMMKMHQYIPSITLNPFNALSPSLCVCVAKVDQTHNTICFHFVSFMWIESV